MMKKNIVIQFLLLGYALGQTIELGNTVFNSGGSGETGTMNTGENYRYQHTVSVGSPFIGTTGGTDGNGNQYLTTLGQFNFYNFDRFIFFCYNILCKQFFFSYGKYRKNSVKLCCAHTFNLINHSK